jgi:hypothetical protein
LTAVDVLKTPLLNPLTLTIFTNFVIFANLLKFPQSGYHKVKPFYSGRIAFKLMVKHTSLLIKNTVFEHKFHVDTRKWQKLQNSGQIPFPVAKNLTLFGQKQLDLEGNIEQTA